MSKSTQTQLMTASEVAAAFGRDTRTISRWTREGRLTPTTKLPGKTGAYLKRPTPIGYGPVLTSRADTGRLPLRARPTKRTGSLTKPPTAPSLTG